MAKLQLASTLPGLSVTYAEASRTLTLEPAPSVQLQVLLAPIVRGPKGEDETVTFQLVTGSVQAVAGDRLIADTRTAPVAIALPANPAEGDSVTFKAGALQHVLTLTRSGHTILGVAEDLTVDLPYAELSLVWNGATWTL